MPTLGVNIDRIATIRQARRTVEPDSVAAAADGNTVHLREDRRHIQERDVRILRQTVRTQLAVLAKGGERAIASELRVNAGHSD